MPGPAGAASDFETQLLKLAERALAGGDLRNARDRFARVLAQNEGSAAAHAGLGAVALAEGDPAAARASFLAAVERAPGQRRARLGLAELAVADGGRAEARAHLDAALAASPLDPVVNARRFALTGLAREPSSSTPQAVQALAAAHPYDPRAQLDAARASLAGGEREPAKHQALMALLMADLRPGTGALALAFLAELGDEDVPNRLVPVHVYADETVRAREGWRFELRFALSRAARGLGPLLGTQFIPVSFRGFSSAGASDALASIHESLRRSVGAGPPRGIVAGFTRRKSPRTANARRLGQANYLGRELVVRLDPADREGRTLAHEILHLYGGIHLDDSVPSLMNPAGGVWRLDRYNAAIVGVTRQRGFSRAGLERDVLEEVDEEALVAALAAGLDANLKIRNAGIRAATREAQQSRFAARATLLAAIGEDRNLGDVARLCAIVLLRNERAAEAVAMMESAARLYGPRTGAGRAAQAEADRWRAAFKALAR